VEWRLLLGEGAKDAAVVRRRKRRMDLMVQVWFMSKDEMKCEMRCGRLDLPYGRCHGLTPIHLFWVDKPSRAMCAARGARRTPPPEAQGNSLGRKHYYAGRPDVLYSGASSWNHFRPGFTTLAFTIIIN
jgi:hypothetical protein